jgi:hypothetical protein
LSSKYQAWKNEYVIYFLFFLLLQECERSLAHADEPLEPQERKLLLDDDGESHILWQYECPVVHLYYQYCVWCVVLGLPYYSHSIFYLKIKGVVTQTEYRDGVCGICRAGRHLERKILMKQELSEHEFAQYLLLKVHKVCSSFASLRFLSYLQQHSMESRDYMNFSIDALDLHTFGLL